MPSFPRRHYVEEGEIATYHAWSRCVQRAFLCGKDPYTGDDYNHRREWIESLIEYQASYFAIDVGNYHILSNHEHVLGRTRPDVAATWSDEDVAWRWKMAWPEWDGKRWEARPSDEEIRRLLEEPEHMVQIRKSLASLSWFMARIKEPIAKLANAEMDRTGHFFDGRYKCRRLEDLPAVLTCSVYIDVNQIAAGVADSLIESHCSAIRRRLAQWQIEQAQRSLEEFHQRGRPDLRLELDDVLRLLNCNFLSPISEHGPLILVGDVSATGRIIVPEPAATQLIITGGTEISLEIGNHPLPSANEGAMAATEAQAGESNAGSSEVAPSPPPSKRVRLSRSEKSSAPPTYKIHEWQKEKLKPRASDNPILDVSPEQYQELVTWSAARLKGERDGADPMPPPVADMLGKVGINVQQWTTTIAKFETTFHSAVGAARNLERFIKRTGRSFIHGLRACRGAFT